MAEQDGIQTHIPATTGVLTTWYWVCRGEHIT